MASGRIRSFFNRIFGGSKKQDTEEQRKAIVPKIKIQSQTSAATANTIRDAFRTVNERERTANQNKGFEAKKQDFKSAAAAVSGATSNTARERITPKVSLTRQLAAKNRKQYGILKDEDRADIIQNVSRPAEAKRKVWAHENFIDPMSSHERAADRARFRREMGDEGKSNLEVAREMKMNLPERNAKEAMYETTYHPNRYGFTKGLASGATLGTTDLMMNYASDDIKAADQVYQDNKTGTQTGLEITGNVIGSMAAFGSTGDAMEQLIGRGAQKLAPGTATKIIKGLDTLAKKSPKAYGIVKALMQDAAINVSTGGYSDVMHSLAAATKDGGFDWDVFKDEMKTNAKWNVILGAPISAWSGMRDAKRAAKGLAESADDIAVNAGAKNLDDLLESGRRAKSNINNTMNFRNVDDLASDIRPRHELPRITGGGEVKSLDEIASTSNVRNVMNAVDDAAARNTDDVVEDVVKQNADDVAEQTAKAKPPKKTKTETRLEEVHAEAESVNERMRAAHEAGNLKEEMALRDELDDLAFEEADLRRKIEANRKRAATRAAKKNPPTPVAETVEEAVTPQAAENVIDDVVSPQTARTASESVEQSAEKLPSTVEKLEGQFDELTKETNRVSDGEYATSRGWKNTVLMHDEKTQKEAIADTAELLRDMRKDGFSFDGLDTGGRTHIVKGEAYLNDVAERSLAKVSENGIGKTVENLSSTLASGDLISTQNVIDAANLVKVAEASGDETVIREVNSLFDRIMSAHGTQNGQGMFVQKYVYNLSPRYRLQAMSKDTDAFISRICGITDPKEIKKLKDTVKLPNGTSFEQWLLNIANANSPEEMRALTMQLQTALYRNSEPSLMETLNMFRHTSLLGKPTTALNNFTGNTAQYLMSGLSKKYDAISEAAMRNREGLERTSVLKLKGDNAKLSRGLSEGWAGGKLAGRTERLVNSLDDVEYGKMFDGWVSEDVGSIMHNGNKFNPLVGKGLDYEYADTIRGQSKSIAVKVGNKASSATTFALNEPDYWFVEKNYRRSMANYLQANGIDTAEAAMKNPKVIERARKHAMQEARENTFKEANRLADGIAKIRRAGYRKGASKGRQIASMGIDAVLPYDKVPINMARESIRYSPIGTAYNGLKMYSALRSGDVKALQEASRGFNKGLSGMTLMTLGFIFRCKDQTDDESSGFIAHADEDVKDYGVRDFSLNIHGYNFNLANMGPGATQFLMGAAIGEEAMKMGATGDEDPVEISNILNTIVEPTMEMSIMENAQDVMSSWSAGDTPGESLMNVGAQIGTNYIGQYIPTPLRAIARGTTSADLDTGIQKGGTAYDRTVRRNVNQLINGIPILNEKVLPHKVNAHGDLYHERRTAGDKGKKVAQNLLDPFQTQKINIPETHKEQMKYGGQPDKFDKNRTYQISIGASGSNGYDSTKEDFSLTGKQREQVARSLKVSGKDSVSRVIDDGFFGDSQGARAKQVFSQVPEDEEEALKYIQATPEYKNLSDSRKTDFWKAWNEGRDRTTNHEYYVGIEGKSEDEFEFKNDLTAKWQHIYEDDLKDVMSLEQYLDLLEASTVHKWDGEKNTDAIANTKKGLIESINSLEGLSTEQKIAAYDALKHKNWKDWDGVSGASSGKYRRGYRRSYSRRSGGSKKVAAPIKPSQWKATSQKYSSAADAVRSGNTTAAKGTSVKLGSVKVTPPTPKTRKG